MVKSKAKLTTYAYDPVIEGPFWMLFGSLALALLALSAVLAAVWAFGGDTEGFFIGVTGVGVFFALVALIGYIRDHCRVDGVKEK